MKKDFLKNKLKKIFGFNTFRDNQEEIINHLLKLDTPVPFDFLINDEVIV